METVIWKVRGMTCSHCALTVSQYLEKQGMHNVKVNPIDGDVRFERESGKVPSAETLTKGIVSLGYDVVDEKMAGGSTAAPMNRFLRYTLICLPFTLVLMLHMIPALHNSWIGNPWVQCALAAPVYLLGMSFFGKSAFKSIRNGLPNMNVLVTLGASAAFLYSIAGTLLYGGHGYLFFETTATIITLVFFGNYLEDVSVQSTQKQLNQLVKSQKVMANMIAFDDKHQEQIFPIENNQLRNGDLVLIRTGEQVPADAKILWGEALLNESIITGESVPVEKKAKDNIIGGSLVAEGTLKAIITHTAADSVLANIINLVKKAQGDKPPVQRMADRISGIFVPVVLIIAVITFLVNYQVLHSFESALMRSIAVLVIACPCAMGLATPAAIAVGLGRAARNGILFRDARSLEAFKTIRRVVFDKTGTLTTGKFRIEAYQSLVLPDEDFRNLVYSLEKYSTHPLASAITGAWKTRNETRWASITEIKGKGMHAVSRTGETYQAGSYAIAARQSTESDHNVYILRNGQLIGWIDVTDTVRPEARDVIRTLHNNGIETILLSGDRKDKAGRIAKELGIETIYAEKSPEEKLTIVEQLTREAPTAMVGDGINDAPALAKATIGISLSDASQLAVQTAGVVLMNNGIRQLPLALGLGTHTMKTIRQNLFWAFAYNIVAIPIAAFGFLTPTFGALVMGLSDVVLAVNSARLMVKRVS
ncbi:heavy metal translocating P-type ATPase [Flavihumibacter petaseus]|uniref:Copper-transporting P-type ATPase CopA n=1 Tax=Flavihumibacter petaseus NBRC 106054 TaxID=1220578 RepID=A0A0E9N5F6_9BACT|nr:cation-translocating P-type ATPase [Flavihumibacter petaseus]GAO45038.1 copper-transporting P-type ATPase CopA [Flavihumibacter petaseus NBRC 106054]